jgi:UDP-galactopyranose mutase
VNYDLVVVGAGFAGAVTAQQLHEAGKKVLVVDKRDHIGGNTFDEVDEHGVLRHRYGPHVFNANSQKIVDYLSRFTEWRPYEHKVLARTDLGDVVLPVNINTLEQVYGLELNEKQARALLDELRFDIDEPQTVEEAVRAQVGDHLY